MKDIVKLCVNAVITGAAMYCMWDLEQMALAAGINGAQFMYVVAGIGLLGGVTLAPILEVIKKMNIKVGNDEPGT